jgi:hypothetical protein
VSTIIEIISNEYLLIARCNLKAEFRYGRYGLNQNFILCLRSKYLFPGFYSKPNHIEWLKMKGNPMIVLPHDRGRLFYTITIGMRYWDMWSIISVLFMH